MKPLHLILTAALLLTLCGCAPKAETPSVTPTPTVTAAPVERPMHTAAPTATAEPTTTPAPAVTPVPTVTIPEINLKDNQTPFG